MHLLPKVTQFLPEPTPLHLTLAKSGPGQERKCQK